MTERYERYVRSSFSRLAWVRIPHPAINCRPGVPRAGKASMRAPSPRTDIKFGVLSVGIDWWTCPHFVFQEESVRFRLHPEGIASLSALTVEHPYVGVTRDPSRIVSQANELPR